MGVLVDRCINPNCEELIRYTEGAQEIQCPWCNYAFLAREFKGAQDKILAGYIAGKKDREALELTIQERDALQVLLNKSQQAWIDYANIRKYEEERLKSIEKKTGDIKDDTETLKAGQQDILQAIQQTGGTRGINYAATLERAYVMLEVSSFETARELFEDVLKIEPKEPAAYLGKLMADLKVSERAELAKCRGGFKDNVNYKLLMRFADEALKAEIEQYQAQASVSVVVTEEYRYEGEIKGEKPHGEGRCEYKNGDVYTGSFVDGLRHGKGQYCYATGDRYDGEWKESRKHGHGIMQYADGDKYDGEWKEGGKHGHGIMQYADGDRYDGEWERGLEYGYGVREYTNGNRYAGGWISGKWHGEGVITQTDGTRIEAYFANDKRYPKGIQKNFKNWIAGKRDYLVIYRSDGSLKMSHTYNLFGNTPLQYDRMKWRDIKQIAGSVFWTLGLKADGRVVCANGTPKANAIVEQWENVQSLEFLYGRDTVAGIREDGTLYLYLEDEKSEWAGTAKEMRVWRNISAVKMFCNANYDACYAGLKTDGTMVTAGPVDHKVKEQLSKWKGIVSITASRYCIFGLDENGCVCMTGKDLQYFKVDDWSDIAEIAANDHNLYGLKADGTVIATGWDYKGETKVLFKNHTAIYAASGFVVSVFLEGLLLVEGSIKHKSMFEPSYGWKLLV